MDLDTGTVQTYSFKSHAEKTLVLQAFKNPVQNTGLVPSAHAHIDRMPVSEPFREPPPFAPIFHDIQNGIEHLKVVVGDIASMDGETIRYTLVLHLANLHHATILTYFAPLDNILSEHSLVSSSGEASHVVKRDFVLHGNVPPSQDIFVHPTKNGAAVGGPVPLASPHFPFGITAPARAPTCPESWRRGRNGGRTPTPRVPRSSPGSWARNPRWPDARGPRRSPA